MTTTEKLSWNFDLTMGMNKLSYCTVTTWHVESVETLSTGAHCTTVRNIL